MNLMSCHEFIKIQSPIVILKCHKMMLEYYFLRGFTVYDNSPENLIKILIEVQQRIHVDDVKNYEKS